MRKGLFGALAFLAVVAVLRRFGPTMGKRVMEKCREMMGGAPGERRLDEERQHPTSSIAR
jgi:hypothetical protein